MNAKEVSRQIEELNTKISNATKEIEDIEIEWKRKKLAIKKYKNEVEKLQIELQEQELVNWKDLQKQDKIKRNQKNLLKKYAERNNEYYTQEKDFCNTEIPAYKNYFAKSAVPYND